MNEIYLEKGKRMFGRNGLFGLAVVGVLASGMLQADEISREVRHGDSLSRIALEEWGNAGMYTLIFEENRDQLTNPNMLFPGMTLTFPRDPSDARGVVDEEPLALATSRNYQPFADPGLQGNGFTVEIAKEVFERAGYDVNVTVFDTWPEAEKATAEHEQDAVVPYALRDIGFEFTEPVYELFTQFFVLKDSAPLPTQWQGPDLDGLKVCKPQGYFTEDIQTYLDDGLLTLTRGDESLTSCFEMVERGDADLVAVNPYTGWLTLHENADLDEGDFAVTRASAGTAPMRVMIAEDHPDANKIVEDFNESLEAAINDGTVSNKTNEALSRYFRDVLADIDRSILEERSGSQPATGSGRIVLRTGNNYEPFADEGLPEGGMSTEIALRAVNLAFSNPDVDLEHVSWPEAYSAVVDGDADAAFPYVVDRSDSGVVLSKALNQMGVHIYVEDDSALQEYRGRASLDGMWACKPDGYYTSDLDDLIDADRVNVINADSDDPAACFDMLAEGQVDFVSFNPFVAESSIDRSSYSMSDFRDLGSHYQVGLGFMARDDSDGRDFVEEVNEVLQEMEKQGEISAISERHIQLYFE